MLFAMYHILHHYSASDNKEDDLLALMKQKLPSYVMKCFLAAGFDSEEAIVSMNTNIQEKENSIKVMEQYIEKRFSHDPTMHSEFSFSLGVPFEFPPGHVLRICSFVKEVKQNHNRKVSPIFNSTVQPLQMSVSPEEQTMDSCSRKRTIANNLESLGSGRDCKQLRVCIDVPANTELPIESETQSMEQRQVQSSINYWIETHQVELFRGLNKDHYCIKVVKSSATPTVYVKCLLCHTSIKLQPKATKKKGLHYGISNWTKHVTPCYLKRIKSDQGQLKLELKPMQLDVVSESDSSSSIQKSKTGTTLVKKMLVCSESKKPQRPS